MTVVSIPAVSSRICRSVSKHVWGDRFGGQAWAGHRGGCGVLCEAGSDGVAAHLGSCAGGENESLSVTWLFATPDRPRCTRLPACRSSWATSANRRAPLEVVGAGVPAVEFLPPVTEDVFRQPSERQICSW